MPKETEATYGWVLLAADEEACNQIRKSSCPGRAENLDLHREAAENRPEKDFSSHGRNGLLLIYERELEQTFSIKLCM